MLDQKKKKPARNCYVKLVINSVKITLASFITVCTVVFVFHPALDTFFFVLYLVLSYTT